jgi:hypothetical protein
VKLVQVQQPVKERKEDLLVLLDQQVEEKEEDQLQVKKVIFARLEQKLRNILFDQQDPRDPSIVVFDPKLPPIVQVNPIIPQEEVMVEDYPD